MEKGGILILVCPMYKKVLVSVRSFTMTNVSIFSGSNFNCISLLILKPLSYSHLCLFYAPPEVGKKIYDSKIIKYWYSEGESSDAMDNTNFVKLFPLCLIGESSD